MAIEILDTWLTSSLASGGTITFSYPGGRTAASYLPSDEVLMIPATGQTVDDPVVTYGSSTITVPYTGATLAANTRIRLQVTLREETAETPRVLYNGVDYGASPAGAVSARDAIQHAMDACSAAGGGIVYLEAGTYLKPGSATALVPRSNVTLQGVPGLTVIQLDATGINPIMRSTSGSFSNFHMRDIIFDGGRTSSAFTEYGANPDIFYGENISLRNVTVRNMRTFGLGFSYCDDVLIDGCKYININRDGCYAWNTSHLKVTNSYFEGVNDDAISAHTDQAATAPLRASITITGNQFFRCQGVKVLGPKAVVITDNVMRQMMSYGINVGDASTQGDTVAFSCLIRGNIVNDVFLRQEDSPLNSDRYYMRIQGPKRNAGGGANFPGGNNTATGDIVDLFGTGVGNFYTTNTDNASVPGAGAFSYIITDNVLERTLPPATVIADWGYGNLEVGGSGTYADDIPESALNVIGIRVQGHLTDAIFARNIVRTTGTRAVDFIDTTASAATITDLAFDNVVFDGNVFKDFSEAGMYWPTSGASEQRIIVRNNHFDGDPRQANANRHASNGSWQADSTPIALRMGNCSGKWVTGNTFRNVCSVTQDGGTSASTYFANMQFCDPAAVGFSTSNKGIGNPQRGTVRFMITVEDSDPSSATYGQVSNVMLNETTAVPSSGKYVLGHVVKNSSPSLAAGKVTFGWIRLTTSSNHVDGTDWTPLVIPNT